MSQNDAANNLNHHQRLKGEGGKATTNKVPFNWPIVSFLLLMTGIPGIPAVFLIAVVLMGPGAIEGVSLALNQFHFDTPLAIVVHGGAGFVFFLSMPFQFSPALRSRGSRWHKRGGYAAVVSGYVMAISGIWMHHVLTPEDLGARYVSLWVISIGICVAFTIALQKIFARKVKSHQAWMCRAVAITLAVVTPIFLEIPVYMVLTQLDDVGFNISKIMHDYGRIMGMVVNLVVVEYVLRRKPSDAQANQLPQASGA